MYDYLLFLKIIFVRVRPPMNIVIFLLFAILLAVGIGMRRLLVEISRKLNFLNDQVKELHKNLAELSKQPPRQRTAQPEETVVVKAQKTSVVDELIKSSRGTQFEAVAADRAAVAKEALKQQKSSKIAQRAVALANSPAETSDSPLADRASEALANEGVADERAAQFAADTNPQKSAPSHRNQAGSWFGKVFKSMLENFRKTGLSGLVRFRSVLAVFSLSSTELKTGSFPRPCGSAAQSPSDSF